MSTRQTCFRLNLGRLPQSIQDSDPSNNRKQRFAALLRRQAASVAEDVTSCPPAAITHHMRRLRDLQDLLRLVIGSEGFLEPDERERSDRQLIHPATVADWAAVLDQVAKTHRSPAYVSSTQAELAKINGKMDLLAALFSRQPGALEAWEAERSTEL